MTHKLLILVFTLGIVLSCSDNGDPELNPPVLPNSYFLAEYVLENATDLNEDGTSSNNVFEEYPCLEELLLLNENFDYLHYVNPFFVEDGVVVNECDDTDLRAYRGIWTTDNDKLVIFNDNGQEHRYDYLLERNFLTIYRTDSLFGNVTMVFEAN